MASCPEGIEAISRFLDALLHPWTPASFFHCSDVAYQWQYKLSKPKAVWGHLAITRATRYISVESLGIIERAWIRGTPLASPNQM